jgi:hypothetical protein
MTFNYEITLGSKSKRVAAHSTSFPMMPHAYFFADALILMIPIKINLHEKIFLI